MHCRISGKGRLSAAVELIGLLLFLIATCITKSSCKRVGATSLHGLKYC